MLVWCCLSVAGWGCFAGNLGVGGCFAVGRL